MSGGFWIRTGAAKNLSERVRTLSQLPEGKGSSARNEMIIERPFDCQPLECIIVSKGKHMSAILTPDVLRAAAAHFGRKGGKIGGKSKSLAKLAAARRNGKLFGGRPPKKAAA